MSTILKIAIHIPSSGGNRAVGLTYFYNDITENNNVLENNIELFYKYPEHDALSNSWTIIKVQRFGL